MLTCIINLERDVERKNILELQLQKEDVRYEFIRAIDGQNDDLDKYEFKVIPDWVEPFTSKVMKRGEIGCALTHYQLWEKIVNEKLDYMLILEDDVILCDNFNKRVAELLKELSNFDMLYLGRRPLNKNEIKVSENITKAKYSYGMHAYILSYAGAQKLLKSNYLNNLFPVDEFLPLLYDEDYPLTQYLKYFENKCVFDTYAAVPVLVDIVFGEKYKSTTYNSEAYNNPKTNEHIILSVGTDYNDALKRFEKSCQTFGHPYKILGLGTVWRGGDMEKGPGGGQKINLLKKELLSWSEEELNKIVIFTDSYDVIVSANINEIMKKYHTISNDAILFSSEVSCWPDKNLADLYPKSPTKMKYLNSGGFIGKACDILKIMDTEIKNHEDDQYYYTMKFLNQTKTKIVLDYYCEIFQTLNNCTDDIDIRFNNSRVSNKFNKLPCIIHGNGPPSVKLYLNNIGNYLIDGWSSTYKYHISNNNTNTPKIYICCHDNLDVLDYPKEQCIFKTIELENVVEDFLASDAEYLFVVEKNYIITNPNTLKELLNINENIAGPMMKKNSVWTNFWGELDKNGYYKRSFDYLDIVNYTRKSVWNVPYLTGVYLIKRTFLEKNPNVYANATADLDMHFCKNVRNTNTFMYITNMNVYGYVDDLTIYDIDNTNWEKKYIHPEFKNMDFISEPCKDVYLFPIFTKVFCDELMKYCNELNEWSDGKNDNLDPRLNAYENVPTQDIHLTQIKFESQWEQIVFKYIAPVASKMYSFYKTKNINISFVVKYSMEGQKKLVAHHDSSSYTINVCLNDEFEGGGCRFVRQNVDIINKSIGYASIHPGRLTHYHEGLQITNGNRYILVSFIN